MQCLLSLYSKSSVHSKSKWANENKLHLYLAFTSQYLCYAWERHVVILTWTKKSVTVHLFSIYIYFIIMLVAQKGNPYWASLWLGIPYQASFWLPRHHWGIPVSDTFTLAGDSLLSLILPTMASLENPRLVTLLHLSFISSNKGIDM